MPDAQPEGPKADDQMLRQCIKSLDGISVGLRSLLHNVEDLRDRCKALLEKNERGGGA